MTPFEFSKSRVPLADGNCFLIDVPTGLNSKEELLNALANRGNFPSYFGSNWDALLDCLTRPSGCKCGRWAVGGERAIAPIDRVWDSFFEETATVSDDFFPERASQDQADREALVRTNSADCPRIPGSLLENCGVDLN